MIRATFVFAVHSLMASQAMAGDVYASLAKPNGKLAGLGSAESIDATADIREARARHVKLPPHRAFSSWPIAAEFQGIHIGSCRTGRLSKGGP